ncbi:MAG: ATP-binding cassette, subfamily bacterial [Acidimicrobiaceae bacterium]|jgi:ABC-type multidrug transport system fused ATPase/permease subunit
MDAHETAIDPRHVLRAHLWPERRALAGLIGALVIGTVLPLTGPIILGHFVDRAIAGAKSGELAAIAIVYLVVAAAAQAATVVRTWVASRQAWTATNRLREELAEHTLSLDISYHGKHPPGELIERVDGDVHAIAEFLVTFLVDILGSAPLLAGTLIVLTVDDIRLGAALAAFVVAASLFLVRVQRRAVPTSAAHRAIVAGLFADLEEHLAAAEDLRANGAGAHIVRRFHDVSAEAFRADRRAEIVGGGLVRLTNLAFTLGTAMLLGLGVLLQRSGAISVGTLLVVFRYSQIIRQPLERIIDQLKELQRAQAGVARAAELFAEHSNLAWPSAEEAHRLAPTGSLSIELRDVSFSYGDENVLDHIDLRLEAGRSIGLVGRTGSGKSTITRLMLRLYDPGDGAVLLDGVDLRRIGVADLRQRVAMVTQEVQLFRASLRENLTLFETHPKDDDALLALLDELGLGPWLRAQTHGLDTELGPDGSGLSAGEAQLLALARAFLADPGLVILDEPSSRLDPDTELLVERAVDRLSRGRTTVLVAHRLSSLRAVDEIAVVDHGRIVEHDARESLVADPSSRFSRLLAASR